MTSSHINKAVLLAAGFGTRLKPLTDSTPKPLIPLNGKRLIDFSLSYLAAAGIREVALNLHYLGEQIRTHVGDGKRYQLRIHYSEEREILGTGGGVKQASRFFEGETIVVLNSDTLLECDLRHVMEHHFSVQADATMVLCPREGREEFGPVEVEQGGWIRSFNKQGDSLYSGLQVIGPKLLEALPPAGEKACLIQEGYQKLIASGGKVAAFIYSGYWNDLGTWERYEEAKQHFSPLL